MKTRLICAAFIHDDFMEKVIVIVACLKNVAAAHVVTLFRQHKIDSIVEFVDSTIQVAPFTLDLYVGFIHPRDMVTARFHFLACVAMAGE